MSEVFSIRVTSAIRHRPSQGDGAKTVNVHVQGQAGASAFGHESEEAMTSAA